MRNCTYLPKDFSLGVLLATMLTIAYAVVIPSLRALQIAPHSYYRLMPVVRSTDIDRDGVLDLYDVTPYGTRMHAEDGEGVLATASGATLASDPEEA